MQLIEIQEFRKLTLSELIHRVTPDVALNILDAAAKDLEEQDQPDLEQQVWVHAVRELARGDSDEFSSMTAAIALGEQLSQTFYQLLIQKDSPEATTDNGNTTVSSDGSRATNGERPQLTPDNEIESVIASLNVSIDEEQAVRSFFYMKGSVAKSTDQGNFVPMGVFHQFSKIPNGVEHTIAYLREKGLCLEARVLSGEELGIRTLGAENLNYVDLSTSVFLVNFARAENLKLDQIEMAFVDLISEQVKSGDMQTEALEFFDRNKIAAYDWVLSNGWGFIPSSHFDLFGETLDTYIEGLRTSDSDLPSRIVSGTSIGVNSDESYYRVDLALELWLMSKQSQATKPDDKDNFITRKHKTPSVSSWEFFILPEDIKFNEVERQFIQDRLSALETQDIGDKKYVELITVLRQLLPAGKPESFFGLRGFLSQAQNGHALSIDTVEQDKKVFIVINGPQGIEGLCRYLAKFKTNYPLAMPVE